MHMIQIVQEAVELEWWQSEILLGVTVENILDYVLLAIILAGIAYSIFFRRSKNELI